MDGVDGWSHAQAYPEDTNVEDDEPPAPPPTTDPPTEEPMLPVIQEDDEVHRPAPGGDLGNDASGEAWQAAR